MRKRIYLLFFLIMGVLSFTHCVSPYYGTARIEPGWNLNTGLGVHTTLMPLFDASPIYGIGLRYDAEIGFGVEDVFKPYARGAVGLNTASVGFADAGAGFQIAVPVGPVTPAVRAELNSAFLQPTFSPAVLLGIGKHEVVTLGAKWYLSAFADPIRLRFGDLLITIHPSPRWSVFAGAEISEFIEYFEDGSGYPFFTVGVGYKMPPWQREHDCEN